MLEHEIFSLKQVLAEEKALEHLLHHSHLSRESPPQDSETGVAMPWGCDIALRNSGFLSTSRAGVKHTSEFLLHRWFQTYIKNNWVYFFSTSQLPSFVLLFVYF